MKKTIHLTPKTIDSLELHTESEVKKEELYYQISINSTHTNLKRFLKEIRVVIDAHSGIDSDTIQLTKVHGNHFKIGE